MPSQSAPESVGGKCYPHSERMVRDSDKAVPRQDREREVGLWPGSGRSIDEAIAIAEAFEAGLGYAPVPDADWARDVQEAIEAHREPLGIAGLGLIPDSIREIEYTTPPLPQFHVRFSQLITVFLAKFSISSTIRCDGE